MKKMCNDCNRLMDRGATECPTCGAGDESPLVLLRRAVQVVFPSASITSFHGPIWVRVPLIVNHVTGEETVYSFQIWVPTTGNLRNAASDIIKRVSSAAVEDHFGGLEY